jgi:arylsulfatase A-like enzyme
MRDTREIFCILLAGLSGLLTGPDLSAQEKPPLPNIVFILADYGELGCYGQKLIRTPEIDRMAKESLRFTQCYAGSTVCAPSRCCLMTGKHTGHALVRGNALVPLRPEDVTVAEVLKSAGYTTGLVGKWGLGEAGSTGIPTKQGFDSFFGYLNQVHAHAYYPTFLWHNETKVPLPNTESKANVLVKKEVWSPDRMIEEGEKFIRENKSKPFFLYFAMTLPHVNNELARESGHGLEIPDDAPYSAMKWTEPQRKQAAMITRMDRDVGRLLAALRQHGIDDNTLVFFSSDNGASQEGGSDPKFFNSSGPVTGAKRSLTDGGIRTPMIVRWPGKIQPGVSDHVWAFWDLLPTVAELTGQKAPADTDGLSVLPTLLGKPGQKKHEFLYWEFHEGGSKQAVRMGDWKAIRQRPGAPLALYDLSKDIAEKTDVAAQNPDVVAKIENYLKSARSESETWPLRAAAPKKK